jgi:hypothetical protein
MINNTRNWVVVFLFSAIAIAIYPLSTLLVTSLFLMYAMPSIGRFLPSLVFVVVFSVMNLHKSFEGDFVWYFEHYLAMGQGHFFTLFSEPYAGVQAKYSEPVYYFLSYAIAMLSDSSLNIYILSITILIYGISLLSTLRLCSFLKLTDYSTAAALIVTVTLCITFTLTTHLIRQNLAGSFLFLSFTYLVVHNYKYFLIMIVLSIGTHNSALIPALLFLSAFSLNRYESKSLKIVVQIFFAILLAYLLPYIISPESDNLYTQSDGDISLLVIVYDVVILAVATYLFLFKYESTNKQFNFMMLGVLSFFIFVMLLSYSPLLQLRYYLFFDYFRVVSFLVVIYFYEKKIPSITFVFFALFIGIFYTNLRIEKSTFNYKGSLMEYLTKDMSELADATKF